MAGGIDVIENSLYNNTGESISKEELERLRIFQEKAIEFLNKLKETMKKESKSISLRTFASQLVSLNMNKTMEDNANFHTIMGALADFEHALNVFLNRTEYLTYVSNDGKLHLYDEIGTRQIYEKMEV